MNVLLSPHSSLFPHQHENNRLSPPRSRKLLPFHPSIYSSQPTDLLSSTLLPPLLELIANPRLQFHRTTCLPENEKPMRRTMKCRSRPAALQRPLRDSSQGPQRKYGRQMASPGVLFLFPDFWRPSTPASCELCCKKSANSTRILAMKLPAAPHGLRLRWHCRFSKNIRISSARRFRTVNRVPTTHTTGSNSN